MTAEGVASLGVVGLSEAFREGRADPVEVLEAVADAVAARNPRLDALLDLRLEAARREAVASAARHRAGAALSPLDGVPFGVKANIAVAGLPLHAGIAAYRDDRAGADAPVVAALRAAGAIPVGTLNMHEGALGATSDNPHFGRCGNPWGDDLTPGGSSGGSAAAVAAGLVPFALGTDTMGSVRIPSAYCGVAGLKPTRGLLPLDGLLALSPTLDHVGVHARTAEDVALVMTTFGVARVSSPPASIGDCGAAVAVDADVAAAFADASAILDRAGRRPRIGLDGFDFGGLRRRGLLVAEVEGRRIHEARLKSDRAGFSESFAAALEYGAAQPKSRIEAAYAALAEAGRRFSALVEAAGVLMLPTAPQTPFRWDTDVPANQADFTCLANFAGLPAVAVPAAASGAPPASVQFVAPAGRDDLALAAAAAFEAARGPAPRPA